MGRIISLRGDDHHEFQALLPWYAVGRLETAEHAQVEAHVNGCPDCQAELKFDRRLRVEVSDAALDVEQGWRLIQDRLDAPPLGQREGQASRWTRRDAAPWLGWAVAAALLLVVFAALAPPAQRSARYHVLGASQADARGDMVVIFRPETTERQMRDALNASNARLVDGPTSAEAYVLYTPPSHRTVALAALRANPLVTLAQPIDSGPTP
jgi:hypothetical protein